ncbi:MAG: phenylpyruvate tautomerase MIF-related protein [bacterium]
MPLLVLKTTATVPIEAKSELIIAASHLLAEATGKPEAYCMVTMEQVSGCFDGKECQLAFADVRGIGGFSKSVNTKFSKGLCDLLESRLAIPPDRVYCTFIDVPASSWGWNRSVFG